MSGTLTIGTNDAADNTGDLIVSFVDAIPAGTLATDGSRTALPGDAIGTYLIAPSISSQTGCVVTQTPTPTSAQWESCSLIWQPPPHAATFWTSGGMFAGSGGAAANPKFPPQSFSGAGETDAAAGFSGRIATRDALGASVGASAGIGGRLLIRAATGATMAGAGRVTSDFTIQHPGGTLWFTGGLMAAGASISGRINQGLSFSSRMGAAAGISGDATRSAVATTYSLSGSINGGASIVGNPWIGHQYFVSGLQAASGGVVPFGGNAPLRVTNWVRNPRPEGVVIGNVDGVSNTGPTDWWLLFANPDSMLAVTMIGSGTEGIIPYVDIRWNNATCPGGFQSVQTDGGILVNSGAVWSYSVFCRLVGGSLANISSIGLQILTDGPQGFFNGPTITPTSAALSSQWSHWDGVTVTDPGMTNIAAGLVINANAGAVDLTLRIGGPKAEKAVTASGPQYQAIPQIGFVPPQGGSASFVY